MSVVYKLAPLFAPDAHAVRFLDRKSGKYGYRKVASPLTDTDIARHVSRSDPEASFGAYMLRDLHGSQGHVLVFDIDDHDGDTEAETTAVAIRLSKTLDNLQCPHLVFRSGGGKGYHIYLLFEEPQTKSWLRAVGKHVVIDTLHLKEGTDGVKKGEIEIFPKNDKEGGENVIALPLARKSVALRRDGDVFVEVDDPGDIPFCPPLNHINDPGYPKRSHQAKDPRQAFLGDLLRHVDCSDHYVQTSDETGKRWQSVGARLTIDALGDHSQPVGANLIIDPASEKGHATVIAVREALDAEQVSAALNDAGFTNFMVTSASGDGFYVWVVSATPKRRDQLRKIGDDAVKSAGITDAVIYPGKGPVELPFAGASKFVTGFTDGTPQYGAIPSRVPRDQGRKSGPRQKTPDRDKAFACLVAELDASNFKTWVRVGHLLIAAFGKDDPWTFDTWSTWSMTAPNADDLESLEEKWEKLADAPSYSAHSFWCAAKDAGYDGAMPFSKAEEQKFRCLDIMAEVELFRSQDEIPFATIGPRRHVPVRSQQFEHYVRMRSLARTGDMLSAEILHAVLATIEAKAATGLAKHNVEMRVARHGDKGYLFLQDDDDTVVEYDATGFRKSETPPVRFRSAPGAKPLPFPQAGSIDDVKTLFNLDDENWAFMLAWMTMILVSPGRPTPICVLNGEHGSAKTTALKQIISLIDPKIGATAGPAKSEDDLIASAYAAYIVSFDNVSSFYALSDPLCRLATGGGLRKRQLYTDNALAAYDVIRPVLVSGIDPTANQQDLVERILTVELERPEAYLSDREVSERFEAMRPKALGALLALAGKIIGAGPLKIPDLTLRMADFAVVGEAVAQELGFAPRWFIDAYTEMLESAAAETADGDPVYAFLEAYLVENFSYVDKLQIGAEARRKPARCSTPWSTGSGKTWMAWTSAVGRATPGP